jgi:Tol biopolymer transport system component/DNA-binding winged helix-turn-helix (wHTH) protein
VTQVNRKPPFALEDWIVEPEFNQLTRGNATHRVEPKVMSVLLRLASQAQHVVSKDEILRAVWPGTFVTEDALTRCISVLRHILEDDLRNPRFIKTVPKVGYCLLIAARTLETAPTDLPAPDSPKPLEERQHPSPHSPSAETAPAAPPTVQGSDKRVIRILIGTVALSLTLAAGIVLWVVHTPRAKSTPPTIRTFQLTTEAGEQSRPAFSPDGKRLAFVWAKDDGSRQHIYIKEMGGESLLRLTDLPDSEYSPAWSPDGKKIAFLSSSDAGLGLYVASLSAPPSVRKIYVPGEIKRWEEGALSWSPDGKSFALVDHVGAQASSSIYLINVETLRARELTTPPPGWEGDIDPVFSSDGTKIAFLRVTEGWNADVYWLPTSGGEPHQITHDDKKMNGIAWSSDNQSIVFSSDRAGQDALWKVSLKGGAPERMPVGSEDATQPAISLNGNNLAFVQGSAVFGILRVSASTNASRETRESLIVSSTAQDSAPSISPDGARFAFQSWRSGSRQIWLSSIDGHTLRQLTELDGVISGSGSPSWSPDGGQILFDARIYGHAHIFVIAVDGGNPKQLTFGDVNDIVPRWSADGHSIYFRSNRSDRWQLWKLPVQGGTPQAVTSDDGIVGYESPDGKWLYFARGDESNGIWRMPASGGEAVRILDQPMAGYWGYWAVTPSGICFLDQRQSTPSISIYDPVSQKTTVIAKLNRLPPLFSGLTALEGGREFLISNKYDAGSHISIAQGVF